MQISVGQEIVQFFHEAFRRKPKRELTAEQRWQRRGAWYFAVGLAVTFMGTLGPMITSSILGNSWIALIMVPGVAFALLWVKFLHWYEKKGWDEGYE